MWRCSGGTVRGNFSTVLMGILMKMGRVRVYPTAELLHGGIITLRDSPWENFPWEKLSIGKGGGRILEESVPHREEFWYDLEKQ